MATSSTGKGSHPKSFVTIHLSGPFWGHAVAMLLGTGFVRCHGSTQQCPGILYWGQPPGFKGMGIGMGMLAMHANTAANKRQLPQPLDGLDLSTPLPLGPFQIHLLQRALSKGHAAHAASGAGYL